MTCTVTPQVHSLSLRHWSVFLGIWEYKFFKWCLTKASTLQQTAPLWPVNQASERRHIHIRSLKTIKTNSCHHLYWYKPYFLHAECQKDKKAWFIKVFHMIFALLLKTYDNLVLCKISHIKLFKAQKSIQFY